MAKRRESVEIYIPPNVARCYMETLRRDEESMADLLERLTSLPKREWAKGGPVLRRGGLIREPDCSTDEEG